jgi:hypothetical protein
VELDAADRQRSSCLTCGLHRRLTRFGHRCHYTRAETENGRVNSTVSPRVKAGATRSATEFGNPHACRCPRHSLQPVAEPTCPERSIEKLIKDTAPQQAMVRHNA